MGALLYLEPERGFEPANLPITNRLRYPCATRARITSSPRSKQHEKELAPLARVSMSGQKERVKIMTRAESHFSRFRPLEKHTLALGRYASRNLSSAARWVMR